MAICHLSDNIFADQEVYDLKGIVGSLESARMRLAGMKVGEIVEILNALGKRMVSDPDLRALEGASYMSIWLRRESLESMCRLSLRDPGYLDGFVETSGKSKMTAQPRGVACHWLANNVPTLGFFSVMMALLTKNASLVKVSETNLGVLREVLSALQGIRLEKDGKALDGAMLTGCVALVSFPSADAALSAEMSSAADVKIIWGGAEAVSGVMALPQKEGCESLVFGPKYSFGVFDAGMVRSEAFKEELRQVATDIVLFNQMACSSPQVLFFEKGGRDLKEIARMLGEAFEKVSPRLLRAPMPEGLCIEVIAARWRYLLDEGRDVVSAKGLDWTILLDRDEGLAEPVQGRCVFLREVDQIEQVLPLVNRRIQAIVAGIEDGGRRERFARLATFAGADRIVAPGHAHEFVLPWDGMLALDRMVRWVSLRGD